MFNKKELKEEIQSGSTDYTKYQKDPVAFAKEVLGIQVITDEVAEMLESVRDNRVTVARSATGTGKTFGAMVASTWFYKCFADSSVYTTANPHENNKILWAEIGDITTKQSALFTNDKIIDFHISRSKKDFITSLTVPTTGTDATKEGKFSGKHHIHMLFVVDEGDTLPDFAYRGIEGCMSGGLIVRLLIMYNPRAEAGAPYRMERDEMANIIHLSAFNHPNVITGEHIIPGAVSREITVQRINEWTRPLVESESRTINCFDLPDFLVGVTAQKMKGNGSGEYPPLVAGTYEVREQPFHYIVLGQYPPQPAQQLISREWVNRARARYEVYLAENGNVPPAGVKPIMGGDVAEYGSDSNCRCLRYGGYIPPLLLWGGMDTVASGDRFVEEHQAYGVTTSYIDSTGLGAGIAPQMVRLKCTAIGVKVAERAPTDCEFGTFKQLGDQLYWSMREWLRVDPGAMLPDDEELIQELLTPTYTVTNGVVKVMPKNPTEGKVCMRDLLKRSPDRMEALRMTFFQPANLLFPGRA